MKIDRTAMIGDQFTVLLVCEHCGHLQSDYYATDNQDYRIRIVPLMRFCNDCRKNSKNQTLK